MKTKLLLVGFILACIVIIYLLLKRCPTSGEVGLTPGVTYVIEGLDANTKGKPIPVNMALDAIKDYYSNFYNNTLDSCNIKDHFPAYEVFSIHDLVEFIRMSDTATTPAYMVVRNGVFTDPNNPEIKRIKTVLYMTDVNNIPVKTRADGDILFFEELRRCPPDTNCMPSEDIGSGSGAGE